jgi:hypothetical protein
MVQLEQEDGQVLGGYERYQSRVGPSILKRANEQTGDHNIRSRSRPLVNKNLGGQGGELSFYDSSMTHLSSGTSKNTKGRNIFGGFESDSFVCEAGAMDTGKEQAKWVMC